MPAAGGRQDRQETGEEGEAAGRGSANRGWQKGEGGGQGEGEFPSQKGSSRRQHLCPATKLLFFLFFFCFVLNWVCLPAMRTLTDVVKGIRANKKNEAAFVQQVVAETKEELKSTDMSRKHTAIQKVTYLHMIGYDCSWAAFHILEVMSDSRFASKRAGYLAASLTFTPETDVMLLTTNLFKKDLASVQPFEVGVAINCLANICTPDLARDLCSDIVQLLNSSRVYIRKKSVLAMYKIFLCFPDALRPSFPQLKDRLEDSDVSVISAAVCVICELAMKNAKNYLPLAPHLFRLLTSLTNNWVLIKIVKLMGALCPLEPRLAKKLVEPITNLITTTPAKSLLFECINTASSGMATHVSVVRLGVEKLRGFVEDPDQNLRYLGLLGLCGVMKEYPRLVADMRDTILNCLADPDITIRKRAVDLVCGMVTKKNLVDVVKKLREYIPGDPELIEKIIKTCSQETYEYVTDFDWYLQTLSELIEYDGAAQYGKLIAEQMIDVCVRVPGVRPDAVNRMLRLLNKKLLTEDVPQNSQLYEVLLAASWIVGEFISSVSEDEDTKETAPEVIARAVSSLMSSYVPNLPRHIQAVFVQAAFKVFIHAAARGLLNVIQQLKESKVVEDLSKSADVEVQERSHMFKSVMTEWDRNRSDDLGVLVKEELNPVAAKAQKKVPVPQGLDLDTPVNYAGDESESDEDIDYDSDTYIFVGRPKEYYEKKAADAAATAYSAQAYQQAAANQPFYLKGSSKMGGGSVDHIPTVKLSEEEAGLSLEVGADGKRKKRSGNKGKHAGEKEPAKKKKEFSVKKNIDMPEGFVESDEEDKEESGKNKKYAALDVDLSAPLKAEEALPTISAYKMTTADDVRAELARRKAAKEEKRKLRKEIREAEKVDSAHKHHKHHKRHHHDDEDESPTKLKEKKHKKHHDEQQPSADAASAKQADLLLLGASPSAAAASPAAASASAAEPAEEKKKEKSKKEKKDPSKASTDEKGKKASKLAAEKPAAVSAASGKEATAVQLPPGMIPVQPFAFSVMELVVTGSDSKGSKDVAVTMSTSVVPLDASNLSIPVVVRNLTKLRLTHMRFAFEDSKTVKFYPVFEFVLEPEESKQIPVQLSFKNCSRTMKSSGTLTYRAQDDERYVQFDFVVPVWMFFRPWEAPAAEVVALTTPGEGADAAVLKATASGVVSLSRPNGQAAREAHAALRELSGLVRAHLVEATESHVMLASVSAKNDRVVFVIRAGLDATGKSGLKLEVRSEDDKLSENLLLKVIEYFSSP